MKFIYLIILLLSSSTFATFQENDTLLIGDDTLLIPIYPLEGYEDFTAIGKALSPDSGYSFATNNYRGYVATWKIENDTLFLIAIAAWKSQTYCRVDSSKFNISEKGDTLYSLYGGIESRRTTLQDIFPEHKQNVKIPAKWFSNRIVLGQRWGASSNDEVISKFEESSKLKIEVKEGVVISFETITPKSD